MTRLQTYTTFTKSDVSQSLPFALYGK